MFPARAGNRVRARFAASGHTLLETTSTKEDRMGIDDKIENKTDELAGSAKEKAGDATDDQDLQAEGKNDQSKANLKQAGEKVKDAFK
jgi:uncharacterized protein YjbJ (UPF0337 family)